MKSITPVATASYDPALLAIDVLVFNSHKMATQTIKTSLIAGGLAAEHCHQLVNLQIEENRFADFLRAYCDTNGRKLTLLSVFRDPLDRMISSFFQSLSKDYYAWTHDNYDHWDLKLDSFDRTIAELESLFVKYARRVDGWGESLDTICRETGISSGDLPYSDADHYGVLESDLFRLCTFRYDTLIRDFSPLRAALGKPGLAIRNKNLSASKTYHEIYRRFESEAKFPRPDIEDIYEGRRHLMARFYADHGQSLIDRSIARHASTPISG